MRNATCMKASRSLLMVEVKESGMNSRRAFLVGLLVLPCFVGSAVMAEGAPVGFVVALGNQVLAVIRSAASLEQKRAYFRRVLEQDFDMPRIAAFVLGFYWRRASDQEKQEIVSLLYEYVLVTFGRRLYDYGGQTLRVVGSRGPAYVITEIERPGGLPIRLDWVLDSSGGVYRIVDLVLDGVSMAATQRSEFARIIQRSGGTVSGLIIMIRQIIANFGGQLSRQGEEKAGLA